MCGVCFIPRDMISETVVINKPIEPSKNYSHYSNSSSTPLVPHMKLLLSINKLLVGFPVVGKKFRHSDYHALCGLLFIRFVNHCAISVGICINLCKQIIADLSALKAELVYLLEILRFNKACALPCMPCSQSVCLLNNVTRYYKSLVLHLEPVTMVQPCFPAQNHLLALNACSQWFLSSAFIIAYARRLVI